MKKLYVLLNFTFALFCSAQASAQIRTGVCTTAFRPSTDETAFAAVGSPLKVADKTCFNNFLIVPFTAHSGAITIPEGEYEGIESYPDRVYFSIHNSIGSNVSSCIFCDPIKYLLVRKDSPKTLCILSKLHIESCAEESSISYTITKKSTTYEGLCTPSLVYYGRFGNTLRFAVNDCDSMSKPSLTYDLNLGKIIRFLDEEIKVIKADNQGIYYQRLEKPELKNNDIVSHEIISKLKEETADTNDKQPAAQKRQTTQTDIKDSSDKLEESTINIRISEDPLNQE